MDSFLSQQTDIETEDASMNINEIDGYNFEKQKKNKEESTIYECKSKRAQNFMFRPLDKPCSLTRKKSTQHNERGGSSDHLEMRKKESGNNRKQANLELYEKWLKHLNEVDNSPIGRNLWWNQMAKRENDELMLDGFDKLALDERKYNEEIEAMIEQDKNLHTIWHQIMLRHHHLQPALEEFLRSNIDERQKLETDYRELERTYEQISEKHEKETLKVKTNVRQIIEQERNQIESLLTARQKSVENEFQKIIREKEQKIESLLESHSSLNSRIAELENSNSVLKKSIENVNEQVNQFNKEIFDLEKENKFDSETNKDLEEKIMLCDLLLREHKNMNSQTQKQHDTSSELLIEAEQLNQKLMGENKCLKSDVNKLNSELEVIRSKIGLFQNNQKCLGPLQITPTKTNKGTRRSKR